MTTYRSPHYVSPRPVGCNERSEDPTPEVIAARTAEIRRGWSDQRFAKACGVAPTQYDTPVVSVRGLAVQED